MKIKSFNLIFLAVMACSLSNHQTYAANILAFITDHSPSHCIIQKTLLKALVNRGHNVTLVSMCSSKATIKTLPNFHELQLTEKNVFLKDFRSKLSAKIKNSDPQGSTLSDAISSLKINAQSAHDALEDPVTRSLLNSGQKFDLFILGWTYNDFLLGIAAHFKCPSVVFHTVATTKTIRDLVASPTAIESNQASAIVHRQTEITFRKRLSFWWEHIVEFVMIELYDHFVLRPYYNQHFPVAQNYPSYRDVKRNVSLVFVGHHFSQGAIRPNVPNLIEIGGIQIKSQPDPLPPKIDEFLRNATDHGAILFSLGTNVNSTDFASEKLEAILQVFAGLQQSVIWKWEGDEIPRNKSDNVLMVKWMPQDDILAHPNIRLFISHCGLGGVTEALFHGVPILGIPFIYDQHMNANKIAEEGWSIHLPYDNITADSFSSAVNAMLWNRTYSSRVKELSKLYRDRPQTALDTAIYWTEYVMRHSGAPHMQTPQVQMNFFQRNSLDVVAFLVLLVVVGYKAFRFLLLRVSASKLIVILGLFLYVDKVYHFIAVDIIVSATRQ
ncbi:hypothetical protein HA402_011366 [Bradysia odoriphaga]|nr:hypothetical protein HA402_011366 [Bradysia odoriphaga]